MPVDKEFGLFEGHIKAGGFNKQTMQVHMALARQGPERKDNW